MGLESSTENIQKSNTFPLDEYDVTLVDTPGFDDTNISDVDILALIAKYLADEFENRRQISGVIYLHRITDNRMGGTALRNFRMFKELCGGPALANTAIVLNMWNEVNEGIRSARKNELVSKDNFFKPAVTAGAKVLTHDNTVDSAYAVLRHLATRRPRPLLIQTELVSQKKQLCETSAGAALLEDLVKREQKQAEQLRDMQKEIEEAIRKKDEEDRRELEEARRKVDETRRHLLSQQLRMKPVKPVGVRAQRNRRRRLFRGLLCVTSDNLET